VGNGLCTFIWVTIGSTISLEKPLQKHSIDLNPQPQTPSQIHANISYPPPQNPIQKEANDSPPPPQKKESK